MKKSFLFLSLAIVTFTAPFCVQASFEDAERNEGLSGAQGGNCTEENSQRVADQVAKTSSARAVAGAGSGATEFDDDNANSSVAIDGKSYSTPIDNSPEGLNKKLREAKTFQATWQEKCNQLSACSTIPADEIDEAAEFKKEAHNKASYWRSEEKRYRDYADKFKEAQQSDQANQANLVNTVITACEEAAKAAERGIFLTRTNLLQRSTTDYTTWRANITKASGYKSEQILPSAKENELKAFAKEAKEAKEHYQKQASKFYEPAQVVNVADDTHVAESLSWKGLAQAYWAVAEEAMQAEKIWNFRIQKHGIYNAQVTEKQAAEKTLEEISRWAQLAPEERRAELITGKQKDEQHVDYNAIDLLWEKAQDAWNNKIATRWVSENAERISKEISLLLESKKSELEKKDLGKTIFGRITSASNKAVSVLQYVSIANISPAVIPKLIAVCSDMANRRLAKAGMKAAERGLEAQCEAVKELDQQAKEATEIALKTQRDAEHGELEAQENGVVTAAMAAVENLKKLFTLSSSDKTDFTSPSARLRAIQTVDPIIWKSPVFVWNERIEKSLEVARNLESELSSKLQPSQELATEAEQNAHHARGLANEAEAKLKSAQKLKEEKEALLENVTKQLKSLEDQYSRGRSDDAGISLENLNASKERKQQECVALDEAIVTVNGEITSLQDDADRLQRNAVDLEHQAVASYEEHNNIKKKELRKIDRAKAQARANIIAYHVGLLGKTLEAAIAEIHPTLLRTQISDNKQPEKQEVPTGFSLKREETALQSENQRDVQSSEMDTTSSSIHSAASDTSSNDIAKAVNVVKITEEENGDYEDKAVDTVVELARVRYENEARVEMERAANALKAIEKNESNASELLADYFKEAIKPTEVNEKLHLLKAYFLEFEDQYNYLNAQKALKVAKMELTKYTQLKAGSIPAEPPKTNETNIQEPDASADDKGLFQNRKKTNAELTMAAKAQIAAIRQGEQVEAPERLSVISNPAGMETQSKAHARHFQTQGMVVGAKGLNQQAAKAKAAEDAFLKELEDFDF